MIILFVILLLVATYGMRFSSFHKDYMSLSSTNAIKGIFAVIILYSHMSGYLVLSDTYGDRNYVAVLKYIGQMMVAPYLFYSGYGLMESVKTKPDYKKSFLRKRVLKILIHFDLAVVLYIITQGLLGHFFSVYVYLTSLIGWSSVGNSNWFIFDILILYICFYIALWYVNKRKDTSILVGRAIFLVCLILCVLLWYFLYKVKGNSWWIDTIFTFPLGIAYSVYKKRIDNLMKNNSTYCLAFFLLFVMIVVWHYFWGVDKVGICTCLFSIGLVLVSMKVKFDNKILQWLGINAFAIYILQRLPMIVLSNYGINQQTILFVSLTMPMVLIVAHYYTKFLGMLDKKYII